MSVNVIERGGIVEVVLKVGQVRMVVGEWVFYQFSGLVRPI